MSKMSIKYEDSLQNEGKKRYREKLKLIGLEECPYHIVDENWIDDPTQWPELTYHHLYHYLIKTPRIYSEEAMENYKSLEAYKFYLDGWVQTVKFIKEKGMVLLKADVRPSYRTTSKPHKPWVAVAYSGNVLAGHCDCMAGLGETCSHVAAILYKIEAAVRHGMTGKAAPTDQPCLWNQNFTKNISGALVAEIDIYTDKAKAKLKTNTEPSAAIALPLEHFESFLNELNEVAPKTVCLSLFADHQKNFIHVSKPKPGTRVMKLPASFRSFFSETNSSLDSEQYKVLKNNTIKAIQECSNEAYAYVEEASRNQAQSFAWFEQRAGRITGSTFYSVVHSSIENPSKSLVTKLCSDKKVSINVPAIVWGREHEDEAIDTYRNAFSNKDFVSDCIPLTDCFIHEDFDVRSIGLVISHEKHWYAASPDSVVFCSCCSYGTLEVKCPYSLRDKSLKEEILKGDFYVKKNDDGNFILRQNHCYYYQVQLEMYVTGAQYCDFVVWTPSEFICVRVPRNNEFLTKALTIGDMYWKKVIIKELLVRSFENETETKEKLQQTYEKCSKCKLLENDMMKCTTCSRCFHPKCVGRKTLAKPKTWNCKDCRQ